VSEDDGWLSLCVEVWREQVSSTLGGRVIDQIIGWEVSNQLINALSDTLNGVMRYEIPSVDASPDLIQNRSRLVHPELQ
jgi:hypothetical protein